MSPRVAGGREASATPRGGGGSGGTPRSNPPPRRSVGGEDAKKGSAATRPPRETGGGLRKDTPAADTSRAAATSSPEPEQRRLAARDSGGGKEEAAAVSGLAVCEPASTLEEAVTLGAKLEGLPHRGRSSELTRSHLAAHANRLVRAHALHHPVAMASHRHAKLRRVMRRSALGARHPQVLVFLHYARLSGVSTLHEATRFRLVRRLRMCMCMSWGMAQAARTRARSRAPARAHAHGTCTRAQVGLQQLARDCGIDTREFDLSSMCRLLCAFVEEPKTVREGPHPHIDPFPPSRRVLPTEPFT